MKSSASGNAVRTDVRGGGKKSPSLARPAQLLPRALRIWWDRSQWAEDGHRSGRTRPAVRAAYTRHQEGERDAGKRRGPAVISRAAFNKQIREEAGAWKGLF